MVSRVLSYRFLPALFLTLCLTVGVISRSLSSIENPLAVKFELKDGDKVSDTVTVVAKVTGSEDTGIERVEFLLDDQPKGSDTSVPYSFDWETLADKEGSHTITATAFDAKGRSKRAKITLIVDNELSKGVDYHVDAAQSSLKAGNLDAAGASARKALKIDPENLKASRTLAAIFRERRELPQALAIMEKANIPEKDTETRAEMVALYIAVAAASDATDEFLKSASKAMEYYEKLQTARNANAGADPMKKGDAKFAKHDWAGAILEYQKCTGPLDSPNMPGMNRLILAYLNAGRIKDADGQIGTMIRYKKADEVTRALQSMLLIKQHQATKARELVQEGVDNSILPSILMAAYADLSMGQLRKARSIAEKAVIVAPDNQDVQLLRGYVMPDAIDADKAVIKALQIDPTIPEAYSLRGFQTMLGRGTKRFMAADQLFDFALKRDSINNYALMGGALSLLSQKRPQEAESLVMQLAKQDPYGPDTHFLVALYYSMADKSAKIQAELEAGRKLDPDRWQDALIPTPQDLIARIYRYRYQPVLTPASLYPDKG